MRSYRRRGKSVAAAACVAAIACLSGCTYLNNRWSDAKQMMDLGFTFSKKPQFGLYANCPMVTPIGYSKVDGYFVGLGGGKLGAGEHHQNNAGLLLWGREENSWKGFGKDDKATIESHKAGFVGIAEDAKEDRVKYRPACVHYLHLGFVGIMWNLNYYKMADFFCGWFGYIPFGERSEVPDRVAQASPDGPTPPLKPRPPDDEPPTTDIMALADLGPAFEPHLPPEPAVPPSSPGPEPPAKLAARPQPKPPAKPAAKPPAKTKPKPVAIAAAKPAAKPVAQTKPKPPRAAAAPARWKDEEIALAVARDVAARKAELAAATRPAPSSRFSLEHLVP